MLTAHLDNWKAEIFGILVEDTSPSRKDQHLRRVPNRARTTPTQLYRRTTVEKDEICNDNNLARSHCHCVSLYKI